MPHPLEGGKLDNLQDQTKVKQKPEKWNIYQAQKYFRSNHNTCTCPDNSQIYVKEKSYEESGVETDQAEQLFALLNQSAKVLNKNQETEETDALTIFRKDNMSTSPLHSQDTQATIVMAE